MSEQGQAQGQGLPSSSSSPQQLPNKHQQFADAVKRGDYRLVQRIWNENLSTDEPIDINYDNQLALRNAVHPSEEFQNSPTYYQDHIVLLTFLKLMKTEITMYIVMEHTARGLQANRTPAYMLHQRQVLSILLQIAIDGAKCMNTVFDALVIGGAAGLNNVVEHALKFCNHYTVEYGMPRATKEMQQSLCWAAISGYVSTVHILFNALGDEDARQVFRLSNTTGLEGTLENRFFATICNGRVIKYILQRCPNLSRALTLKHMQCMFANLFSFLRLNILRQDVVMVTRPDDPFAYRTFLNDSVEDKMEGLRFLLQINKIQYLCLLVPPGFQPANRDGRIYPEHTLIANSEAARAAEDEVTFSSLSFPTVEQRRKGAEWFARMLSTFMNYDTKKNNGKNMSAIIRLMYDMIMYRQRIPSNASFLPVITPQVDFSLLLENRYLVKLFRKFILADVYLMLSEFCLTSTDTIRVFQDSGNPMNEYSISKPMGDAVHEEEEEEQQDKASVITKQFQQLNLQTNMNPASSSSSSSSNTRDAMAEMTQVCLTCVDAYEMNEIGRSKQSILLRYCDKLLRHFRDNILRLDHQYPEGFSVEEQEMLGEHGLALVLEILDRRDPFEIAIHHDDDPVSSSSSSTTNDPPRL